MRRLTGAIVIALALGGCGGSAPSDTTAETCRKIDGLPRGVENTPEAWDRIDAIRRTAGSEVAGIIGEVVKAGKARNYVAVVAPAARLQAICAAAGESLA